MEEMMNCPEIDFNNDIEAAVKKYLFGMLLEYGYFVLKEDSIISKNNTNGSLSIFHNIYNNIKKSWNKYPESKKYDVLEIHISDKGITGINYMIIMKKEYDEKLINEVNLILQKLRIFPEDIILKEATYNGKFKEFSTEMLHSNENINYFSNNTGHIACAKQSNLELIKLKRELEDAEKRNTRILKKLTTSEKQILKEIK